VNHAVTRAVPPQRRMSSSRIAPPERRGRMLVIVRFAGFDRDMERPTTARRERTHDPRIVVRPMEFADVGVAARLHRSTLSHGLFGDLGQGFLRTYYRTFVASPCAVALVGVLHGRVVGLVVGPIRTPDHYRWVVRRFGLRLAARATLSLLARPRQLVRFVRTRVGRYRRALLRFLLPRDPSATASDGVAPARRDVAVLTHIALAPDAQGNGGGRALAAAFAGRCREQGADEVRLVTADDRAAAFYRRTGWEHHDERAAEGGTVIEFRLDLRTRVLM